MMPTEASTREELILEVLKAASDRISIKDFDIQCQLAPAKFGKSYYDRLRVAERLIEEGLIENADNRLRIVAQDIPDWLKNGLQSGSEISWKIFDAIDSTGKIQGKIDHALLEAIGLDGEKEVVRQLHTALTIEDGRRVKHIALTDDTAGFDIFAPSISDTARTNLLEVKTSSRPGNEFRFFISRNEVRVAGQNENWYLIAVLRNPLGYRVLGYLTYARFADTVPVNVSPVSRWESASVRIPVDMLIPGLP